MGRQHRTVKQNHSDKPLYEMDKGLLVQGLFIADVFIVFDIQFYPYYNILDCLKWFFA